MLSNLEIIHYQPPPNHLRDRIILVTGAGSGIGKSAALSCAKAGAKVILAGKTPEKLESIYSLIIENNCPEPSVYPIDFQGASVDDFALLSESINDQFGRLDGLLHNASILGQRTPLNHYSPELWDKVMQINVTSQFQMTQRLMDVLEKSSDASVIFTSSGVGRAGRAYWGAYAVSKFAIEGMMQVWASEIDGLGSVRINVINPGATKTQMRAEAFPAEDPTLLKTPLEIMPAYMYLLGSDSLGVNGQSIDAQIR
jgi:NAD(P)-dependent dehydrogenase (short-subunit alcohol dehydrogenase family)